MLPATADGQMTDSHFAVGGFFASTETRLRVDATDGSGGTQIDYSIIQSQKTELALHLGLHVTDIGTGVTATDDDEGPGERVAVGITAPLPVVGLTGAYRFGTKWLAFARAQYFQLEFNQYDGKIVQFALGVEHHTFERVSLGLGYRSFDIRVDINSSDWVGEIDFEYGGPIAYARIGF